MKRLCASLGSLTALVILGGAASCNYLFDRLDDIPPGAVNGRTVDAEDSVVAFSRVGLESTPRVARALDDGSFQVEGLSRGAWMLRFIDDKDGDGAPEQSALRAIRISDAVDASGDEVLTSVLLGDVTLDGTAIIEGRVVDQAGAPVGGIRVVVYRNTAELDADQAVALGDSSAFDVDLGAEQQTASDDEGRFRLEGVGRGTVRIAAMSLDGALASAPVGEAVLPGDEITTADIVLVPGATRTVQVSIQNPPSDGSITVDVVAHGAAKGTAPLATSTVQAVQAGAVVGGLEVPTTIVDAYVFDIAPDGDVRREGFVLGRVVPAGSGNPNEVLDIVLWGDIELVPGDACAAPLNRGDDRDGDGVRALPDPALDPGAWSSCVTACASSFGTDGAPAVCEAAGNDDDFDCDDDEDGQPDVTEPYECVSMCGGTDLDGDGACAGDVFPQCAADDPADATCAAVDQGDFEPPPSLYEPVVGEPPDVPLDLGPVTSWSLAVPDNTGGDCTPSLGQPNPREDSFTEVSGGGVSFEAISDTGSCCSCIERVRTIPLDEALFDAEAIVGTLRTSFSGELSQAVLLIELSFSGTPTLSQYLKTEERSANNCLGENDALVVDNGGRFELPLFAGGFPIDQVRVHLQGYACGDAETSIAVESFGIDRVGEGEGEGEGELPDDCFGQPAPVCDPAGAQNAYCQTHVDALAGCTALGTVSIFGEGVTTLAPLSQATSIEFLSVTTTSLTSLAGLEALDSLPFLQLSSNPQLADISALAGVAVQSIVITDNDALTNLGGIVVDALTSVSLSDNPLLTDLSALAVPELTSLNISQSPALTSLESLSGLGRVGSLFLSDFVGTSLAGLETLTSVDGGSAILIQSSPSLQDISALSGLQGTLGTLFIDTTGITSLDGLAGVTGVGNLQLSNNPDLVDITAVQGLVFASSISIDSNESLTAIGNFTALNTLGLLRVANSPNLVDGGTFTGLEFAGTFEWSNVPLMNDFTVSASEVSGVRVLDTGLIDLSGFANLILINGDLEIVRNAQMNTLRVQSSLDINGALTATDNPQLDHCLVQTLAETATPGSLTNERNLGSGVTTCP